MVSIRRVIVWLVFLFAQLLCASSMVYAMSSNPAVVRVATFNVSMEASNYLPKGSKLSLAVLKRELASGENPQIRNVAEIIQRLRPDILLLNEFDYIPERSQGIEQFQKHYLSRAQNKDVAAIEYPYIYVGPVNTGEPSPFDLSGDGKASGVGADAWGFGNYPGQYGMAVLSRYPIAAEQVRSFQLFKWKDMPGALMPVDPKTNRSWYSQEAWAEFRLSSKSVWDVPITVAGKQINVLASHPTPPVFDGPEDRNGKRNHDEIRLLADYLSGSSYLYDDNGGKQPFTGQRFVILGDLNASEHSQETLPGTMQQLLEHAKVDAAFTPKSEGGVQNAPGDKNAAEHTATWRSRADYVLPSKAGLRVVGGGVYWPLKGEPEYRLIANRKASSDHRLVYLDLQIAPIAGD